MSKRYHSAEGCGSWTTRLEYGRHLPGVTAAKTLEKKLMLCKQSATRRDMC